MDATRKRGAAERPGSAEPKRASGAKMMRVVALITAVCGVGCSPAVDVARHGKETSTPSRPAACREIGAGTSLQPAIDAAPDGTAFCLAPGRHTGPLRVSRGITLWGPRAAVVYSTGAGTTIRVEGAGVKLLGFTVDGSGARYDLLDAAVHVAGQDHLVAGLGIEHAIYGILVEQAARVAVRDNQVRGDAKQVMGLRGDAIRLWEATSCEVVGNDVEDGRDVVVWYSPRSRVSGNRVRGGRYGTHLMYSHDAVVEDNEYRHDVVGVFIMYSRRVALRGNLVVDSVGAAGMGVGLKDSGDVTLTRNRIVRATTGIYIDDSPAQLGEHDGFEGNLIRLCDAGVVFHAQAERNWFRGNGFADNGAQVVVEGGGDARAAAWDGNYFDDYAGYDLDGDGRGDIPYQLTSTAGALTGRAADLAFFQGTPALGLADAAARLVPLFPLRQLVVDPRPLMQLPEVARAR
jgi:nitrous oxidase accessory protein